jgi:RNA polymerase sigma-70 factor (ECF subfamily)
VPTTLLERIAAGDPNAVEECIHRYSALVWSVARRHFRRRADAEDAVQEAFIAVWRNAARFDPQIASEATFVAMIARRRLIDRRRKQSRTVATQTMAEEPAAARHADHDRMETLDAAERARGFLSQLRTEERRVLEMSLLEGMSQSQIAEVAEMPLGTVKTHARRGLIRLREMLGADPNQSSADRTR